MTNPVQIPPPASANDPFPLGSTIAGRYVLRRELGRGGAASVFAAEHTLISRYVALKLPHPDPDFREVLCARLRRETQALARVRHPVVVDILDAGDDGGMPFLAMQLIEGRTLTGLIAARGQLEAHEVGKIGVELASGLAAIHSSGIIHRDVKPANVIVTRDPSHQVRLFDFGVAKLTGTADLVDSKLTQNGAILGTVEYMAPESLLSSPGNDHRADVYALGVTLYECLTGAVPFDGPLGQVLLKVATQDPPHLTSVKPGIPGALADVVHRCLRRDPGERFATMSELAVALASTLDRPMASIDVLGGAARVRKPPPPLPANRPQAARPAGPAPTTAVATPPAPAPGNAEARRVLPRAPYVTLATVQRDKQYPMDAKIEDISEGGVLLVANEACVQGETVRLRFALPISGKAIDVSATVRWSRNTRGTRATGVEFKDLPEPAKGDIRQYVTLMNGK